jgi:hypothetical protein
VVGVLIEWSPVQDVLDDGVLAVHAVVLRAGGAPALDGVLDHAVAFPASGGDDPAW